jgi:hypothetical protein
MPSGMCLYATNGNRSKSVKKQVYCHLPLHQTPATSTSKRQHSSSPSLAEEKPVRRRRMSTRRQLTPPPTEHTKNSSAGTIETLSDDDLELWRFQYHNMPLDTPVFMKGPDALSLAKNLLSVLRSFPQKENTLAPMEGVQSRIPNLTSLMCKHPDFQM